MFRLSGRTPVVDAAALVSSTYAVLSKVSFSSTSVSTSPGLDAVATASSDRNRGHLMGTGDSRRSESGFISTMSPSTVSCLPKRHVREGLTPAVVNPLSAASRSLARPANRQIPSAPLPSDRAAAPFSRPASPSSVRRYKEISYDVVSRAITACSALKFSCSYCTLSNVM